MDISLKQLTDENRHKFDVLNRQLGDEYKGYRMPIRFEDIKKPTELEPLKPPLSKSEIETEKRLKDEALATAFELSENNSLTPKKLKSKKFIPPEAFSDFLRKLIGSSPSKSRVLLFDMEDASSSDEIKDILEKEYARGVITEEQKKEMENLLSDFSPTKQDRLEKLKREHGIIIG